MRILDKIDGFLDNLDEKYQKNILGKELDFLYKTEEDESIKEIIGRLIQEAKVGGKEYDDFFKKMLKKYKVKSYKDLPKDKQGKFFDAVDKAWNSKVEKGDDGLTKYKKGYSSITGKKN
jgi:superfamily II helicase